MLFFSSHTSVCLIVCTCVQLLATIDELMTFLLVTTFLLIAGVVGLNLFIALLSDTFQRVYDNAQANALLQKVPTIICQIPISAF